MRVAKIDIASSRPHELAAFYQEVLGLPGAPRGNDCHLLKAGATEIFICPRSLAGVAEDAAGVHQLHLAGRWDFEAIRSAARSRGGKAEPASFGSGPPQLCVWDPEGNPVVLSEEIRQEGADE